MSKNSGSLNFGTRLDTAFGWLGKTPLGSQKSTSTFRGMRVNAVLGWIAFALGILIDALRSGRFLEWVLFFTTFFYAMKLAIAKETPETGLPPK